MSIPSKAERRIVSAVRFVESRDLTQRGRRRRSNSPPHRSSTIIAVRNDSGSAVVQFGVLGIDSPISLPATSATTLALFKTRIIMKGVTPTAAYAGKFAILLQPLASGAIGKAVVAGVCQVKVSMTSASDTIADINPSDTTKLKSGSGNAAILWKESGTGTKWAIVDVGAAAASTQTVTVKITGNASGGGKYTGRVWTDPTADVSASGNLAASDLGTDPGSDNALVLNLQEIGQSTHDLTAGTPIVTHFIGRLLRTNADGTKVVEINGTDWQACT